MKGIDTIDRVNLGQLNAAIEGIFLRKYWVKQGIREDIGNVLEKGWEYDSWSNQDDIGYHECFCSASTFASSSSDIRDTIYGTICEGNFYIFGDGNYFTAGEFSDTMQLLEFILIPLPIHWGVIV